MNKTERISLKSAPEPIENPLTRLIDRLRDGIHLGCGFIYAMPIGTGQFKEERRLELYFKRGMDESRLLQATIFPGRSEFFRPWIELSKIQNRMILNRKTFVFQDSDLEIDLHQLFLKSVSNGGKIFVDYENDRETRTGLKLGVPAPATRAGHLLFLNGVTGFRDWNRPCANVPEGCKLQGEKANGEESRKRHQFLMRNQLIAFLQSHEPSNRPEYVIDNALRRACAILEMIQEKPLSLVC